MTWFKGRLTAAAVAFPVAAALAFGTATPARAIEPGQVISLIKQAYDAYKMLTKTKELTLDQATTRIIDAVNAAKDGTLTHIDQVTTVPVRACARAAVIDAADYKQFNTTTKQAFARDTLACVTLAAATIDTVNDPASVDQLGFALDALGPIALIARTSVGFDTAGLQAELVSANNALLTKLNPSCASVLIPFFDANGHPHPELAEYVMTCTAYNNNKGTDTHEGRLPAGGLNFTKARNQAARNTSYPLALASLASLNA
jgi:hypothetical protein